MDDEVEIEGQLKTVSIWCWRHRSYHDIDLDSPDGECARDYFRSNGWSGLDIEIAFPAECYPWLN